MTATGVPDVFDPRRYSSGIPHADFAWLRANAPVSWQPEHAVGDWPAGPGFWAVTGYDDVVRVLRSPGEFSSWLGATQIRDPAPADLPFIRRMMLNLDPPEHGKLRRIVSRAFTPRRVERFRAEVAARARRLVDAVAERGGCDVPPDLTDDFPLLNLADLMGVPEADRRMLLEWTNRIIGYQDPEHSEVVRDADGRPLNPRSPAMLADMFGYAQELAAHKRRHPADDLMTALATAEVDGGRLSGAELEMFFFLLSVAGNDTVRSALPGGLRAFAEHPGQHRLLLESPELLDRAIEETLRYHPPVLSFRRTATTDVELAGQAIPVGAKVVVFHCSANFDPARFDDPLRFDIRRDPNEQLSFGTGPHVCLGAHFARLQLRAFYSEALWRLRDLHVTGPVRHLVSNFINGIKHLPVAFTAVRPR
ncbi:cytochrome P450 [Saccharopolyspora erythraea NRRL 2338]|uniref:Cytochrome P450 CYP125 n=2 Tax=Saccharopolyspora erythraea TaxID=1836 RepID=A4FFH4_SACEN|nr:cytochrome P450 [Saccharopolyspora erythraea]EQD82108.1 cytochrome P450 [Saccharopolyspora erythraea D]PFG96520.1 cytochrome P450 [Saccharopolyspora erythraea NRRL 2338]QRK93011.1 cytochrome P450 [Saccharopolyspora erythraea]CAM02799.1 cytochrome P450 CYP125 [Saccharopolyspora erythraea NRRL 2338]